MAESEFKDPKEQTLHRIASATVYLVTALGLACGLLILLNLAGVLWYVVPREPITTWSDSMVLVFVATIYGIGVMGMKITGFYWSVFGGDN